MLTIFGFGQDSKVYQARVWHAKPMKADAMVEEKSECIIIISTKY